MAEQLQLRQGTAAQCAVFTGAPGEVVFDTTNNRLIAQDGATTGGFPVARLDEVQLNSRTDVFDASYAAVPSDRLVCFVTLSTNRQVQLPDSTTFPLGATMVIVDESGNCSIASSITVSATGGDTINGAGAVILQAPYGYVRLETNQNGKWVVVGLDLASSLLGLPSTQPSSVGVPFISGGLLEISQT